MTTPFYTSPEQLVRDRSEYARKGIARGRSNVVLTYDGGIAFVAENPSKALHKISEIYDRIALAAVGRYNEFESLRVAGVRHADMRGYAYDRRDVTGRALANAYAQTLGSIFLENQKPYEVEIVVAEVGESTEDDQMYRLTFDGSVADEHGYVAMGGQADQITTALAEDYTDGLDLEHAIGLAVDMLAQHGGTEPRTLGPAQLEAAVLDRNRPGARKFRRIAADRIAALLPAVPDSTAAGTSKPKPHGRKTAQAEPDSSANGSGSSPDDGG